jgi:hypothetical protein
VYSVYSVYRMQDRVGCCGGAGGEAEAAEGSTERRGMTREERKLVAAVEISQKLEKDRQTKQDQASKGKETAGKWLAADEAARVSNSSTRKRRRGEEADAAGAGAAKKKKPSLRAPSPKEQMQGVRGVEHLPAPAPKEHMQGVRGVEHLRARGSVTDSGKRPRTVAVVGGGTPGAGDAERLRKRTTSQRAAHRVE